MRAMPPRSNNTEDTTKEQTKEEEGMPMYMYFLDALLRLSLLSFTSFSINLDYLVLL